MNQKEILKFKPIAKLKNLLEGLNRRRELREQISNNEDRLIKIIQSESIKKKEWRKVKTALLKYRTRLSMLMYSGSSVFMDSVFVKLSMCQNVFVIPPN